MPKGRAKAQLSIAELQSLLRERDQELQKLTKQRDKLASQLKDLDRRIAGLKGAAAAAGPAARPARPARPARVRRGGRRRAGRRPLADVISDVLVRHDGPMRLKDIAEAVKAAGYQSKSKNFYNVVSQTVNLRPEFVNAGRGLYKLAEAPAAAKNETAPAKGKPKRTRRKKTQAAK